ncbi:Hachiman antiphage defense system protein HamA [Acutalibacter sp. 1XD8-33]|uniref:Hachiman antiphage defense system protein HamA n=1 Tax=Acutalibacter sp. 1XD8-33 TaxID=2320081 RepID=UPI00242DB164|nr:Hachiman antiphage defense system protein HamA [Acutalibacter sp. 1XD8-33]
MGESKFYTDSKRGIRELIGDLENQFKREYLAEQFLIIKEDVENKLNSLSR